MHTVEISRLFAYGVSGITTGAGVFVLSGLFLSEGIPSEFRITLGVVLILLGVYRFLVTHLQRTQPRGYDE